MRHGHEAWAIETSDSEYSVVFKEDAGEMATQVSFAGRWHGLLADTVISGVHRGGPSMDQPLMVAFGSSCSEGGQLPWVDLDY